MNRQRYKLVFNRHRGQLMAVAEIASSVQHHGRTSAPGVGTTDWLPSVLRFSRLAVTLALALNTVAHAQILGDRNAPRNQQPTVLVTRNGVPVVNIQTPSSAGVSMNQYRQFDVGANGVILNNARVTTATQLGGQVAGNPWLATGAARVIVNQVNSANPSYLRGYLEVAGARAQVVVANPAGISCAGCGFINASRATLTTGVPQVNNGSLESYRVAGGRVSIDGNGMDASRTDYAEIIARAVQVNAGMWAPELKVSAGLNTVSADHTSVVPGVAPADGQPAIAIDVAQLGGMYAGHIYLTSTEHGVGVRNAGTIGASVGQAVVTADGRLENSGAISATGPLALQASGGVRNSGELGSQGAVTVTTSTLDNAGSITSAGTLAVQASDAILNTGSVGGEGGVQMTAASIDNRNSIGSSAGLALQASGNTGHIGNSGTLQATRDVAINAATVDNSGTVRASQGSVQVTSSATATNSGRIEAGQSIAVKAASLDNTASGSINAVDGLRIEATQAIRNSGSLGANTAVGIQAATLDNGGTVNSSRDAVNISTSGQLSNRGQINANQALSLTAAGIDNRTGTLNANDVRIDSQGQRMDNGQGQIIARRDLNITSGTLEDKGGSIAAQGKLTIRSADLGNDGGLLQAGDALNIDVGSSTIRNTNSGSDRGIVAQGPLSITAGALVNRGNVSADGDMRLKTASLDNDSGVIGSNGQLTVQGDTLLNRGGKLQARQGVDLQLGSVDNSGGLMRSDGTVAVQAGSVRNDNTQGQDQGMEGATVTVGAADISNRQGAVRGDSIAMTASNRIDNGSGLLSATDSVSLGDANPAARTLAIDNSNGTVIAGRQTSLLAYSFTGSGKVLSQKDLRIDLVASILHTGQIGATGDATITTSGTFTNAGAVGAGGTLALTAATIDNQAAGSLVGNTLKLKATDVHTFINRGLIDGVNTVIESSTVNNLGTGRIYGDNIAIGADVLNNQAETLNGVTSAPVIAARKASSVRGISIG
ncbi:two-partner secretion domain-containing protein [Herbaspirillum frisingense]|uniref:two-partner secretion domain-containing protein n=1 Tax=Herbaspirillum frisingense TaxID=92645 RepID=UPI0022774F8F|nr:filamentous hemagglutinin N-terminal domain-containing protein [Herbaspirillum frisingense]UIN23086.1 filamentous hemagglutinin N-terminal domain-containing protein [Herbaspirillum frisingense]